MITEEFKEKLTKSINKGGWGKENAKEAIPLIENYIKKLPLQDVIKWVAFDFMKLETRPPKYGKYLITRKDGKIHWETWNGNGWAYNHNEIRYCKKMKYEKGKEITDKCQFKKGKKYVFEHFDELFEFSHIGKNGNIYFKNDGQEFTPSEDECNCIGFEIEDGWYEAIEVNDNLDDKITELIELGRSKGLKINVTFE